MFRIRSLYSKSLKNKILFLFTSFTVIIITIISAFSYYIINGTINDSIRDSISQSTDYVDERINEVVSSVVPLFNISTDYNTLIFLEQSLESDVYDEAKAMGILFENALRVNESNEYIKDISIISAQGNCYSERYGFYTLDSSFAHHFAVKRLMANSRGMQIIDYTYNFHDYEVDEETISLISPTFKIGTNDLNGLIKIDISLDTLAAELFSTENDAVSSLVIINHSGATVINNNPNWHSADKTSIIQKVLSGTSTSGTFTLPRHDKYYLNHFIAYDTIELMGWKTISLMDEDEVMKDLNYVRNLFIFTMMLAIAMALLINNSLSNNIVQPIHGLMKLMKKTEEGNFNIDVTLEGEDEIGELYKQYDRLLSKIDRLLHDLVDEKVNLSKSELKALQAQINPHFLYNTLDSVIWVAEAGETDEVVELTMALSGFYRILLSKGYDFIPLRLEIEHSQNYLKIMKMRYEDILSYTFEIDEATLQYKVPKIILQPIIENAIYHGIKKLNRPGHILIKSEMVNNQLIKISIQDDGVGMDQGKLEELNRQINETTIHSDETYGLKNINQRIQLFYGKDYGIQVTSQPSYGTSVTIMVPLRA